MVLDKLKLNTAYYTNLSNDANYINLPDAGALFTNPSGKYQDIILFQKFGVSQNSIYTATSDITTNVMENNETVQDHWANMPLEYTATGIIGEIIYNEPNLFANYLQEKVLNYLTPLGVISPSVSNYMKSAINLTKQVEENYSKIGKMAINALYSGEKNGTITNQEEVCNKLEILRENRQLVTVWSPFMTLDNMAIKRYSMRQSSESKYQAEIEIDFIRWNNTESYTRQATTEEKAEFIDMQKQVEQNKGNANLSFTNKTGFGIGFNWISGGR